jgi:hypothetical protein
MINEIDVIRLKRLLPEHQHLSIGALGTVLIVYDTPGLPRGYEVEFLDDESHHLALVTLLDDDIELVWSAPFK